MRESAGANASEEGLNGRGPTMSNAKQLRLGSRSNGNALRTAFSPSAFRSGLRGGPVNGAAKGRGPVPSCPESKDMALQQAFSDELSRILQSSIFANEEQQRVWQEKVRLEERTRVAQELHDTLLQTFMIACLHLSAAVVSAGEDSPVKPRLDRVLELMQQGVEEGRQALQGLRSPSSDPKGLDLVVALARIPEELELPSVIDFRVKVTGLQKQLQPEIEHEIYRIGREALVNGFCHSGASHVELEMEYANRGLCMWIRDDGRGIDPQVLNCGRVGHWGLAGMRERATKIGGHLSISTGATDGTVIVLSVPSDVAFQYEPDVRDEGSRNERSC